MRAAWIAFALCAGCNALFDIEHTSPLVVMKDTDSDGVLDDGDNCVDVPNAGQEESDGDALGDACDQCPGILANDNHDEDGDARPDACDACPGLDDFDKNDLDSDGVGDACDYDSHLSKRMYFEPFVTLQGWEGPGVWDVDASETFGAPEAVPADVHGLVRTGLSLGATEWSIHAGLQSARAWQPGDRAGIVAVGPTAAVTSCTIECVDTACSIRLVVDDVLVQEFEVPRKPFERLRLEVKLVNAGTDVHSYVCETEQGITSYGERVPKGLTWNVGVLGGPTIRVSYLDVVQ
jgi:hypothetical protein